MSNEELYTPATVKPLYDELVTAYQEAFAGDPWYEVSKCADSLQRCVDGLSNLAVGSLCNVCKVCPALPAYEPAQLVSKFKLLGASRPTSWYIEKSENKVALAAVAWRSTPDVIAREKYPNNREMELWLKQNLDGQRIAWLDEVFARQSIRATGNLRNFSAMCRGMGDELQVDMLAYRTINPRMVSVAKRDFGNQAIISTREVDVPDRRDFVRIPVRRINSEQGKS